MRIQSILLACAACLAVPASSFAKEDTPLAKHMDAFNDIYKTFLKESNPEKGAALARDAQQTIIKAMAEIPESVKKMPDGSAKAMAGAQYRRMIGEVYVSLCEIETAYIEGKIDEVGKITASLKKMKKAGHGKFMEKDE